MQLNTLLKHNLLKNYTNIIVRRYLQPINKTKKLLVQFNLIYWKIINKESGDKRIIEILKEYNNDLIHRR